MRYVVTVEPGRMELRDGVRPTPAAHEALVRIEAVGLCGSDYHLFDGTNPYARFPLVQGHELVGTVEGLAGGASGPLRLGQRVAVEPLVWCERCFACRRGRPNCCVDLQVRGVHLPGGLAEYVVVPVARLFPTGDLPPEVAVLTEPLSIGLQAVTRADVGPQDRVVVLGAGPIGLAAALGALDRGAEVLVVDRVASRLAHADRLGAHRLVDTTVDDLDAATADFTGDDGAAVVVEATGTAALVRRSVALVAHSGTVVVVGVSSEEVAIPVGDFTRKEVNLLGSRNNAGLFPAAVSLVTRYAGPLAPIVTHQAPLDDAPTLLAYARTHPHEVEKAVVRLSG